MRKLCWVAVVVILVAVVAASVLYGQDAGGMGGGARMGGGRAGGFTLTPEMMKAGFARVGLNDKEQDAAVKNAQAKMKAREALQVELGKLRLVANDTSSTDAQLNAAVAAYTKSMGTYRATVQGADKALAGQLSARSRAKALAGGIIDNGLGMGGGRMGGRGGAGGGRGGRGGAGGPGGFGAPAPAPEPGAGGGAPE